MYRGTGLVLGAILILAAAGVVYGQDCQDRDGDGDVDLDDFMLLKANFGTGTTWVQGDFDGDEDVDLDDFMILKNGFGAGAAL